MNADWKPVAYLDDMGNFFVAGEVIGKTSFSEPDVPLKEIEITEEDKQKNRAAAHI